MAFTLPSLPYAYNALEPYIDARTMEIHHTKHHQAYTDNLNKALEGTEYEGNSIENILSNISKLSVAARNNGGGYYNHNLFWEILQPNKGEMPQGKLMDAINRDIGSFESLKEKFSQAALTRFGSGWAWLIIKNDGKLEITSTPNQDNPLMDIAETKGKPILGLDVWEHAYYLNYQNRRADYISTFWNVVNWQAVSEKFSRGN